MKRILVTGAGGFLGRWICRALREQYQVLALVREPTTIPGVEVLVGDITRPLKPQQIDVLVHLAGMSRVDTCERNPHEALVVNGIETVHALEMCRGLKGVLMASSAKVYGDASAREDALPKPISIYGLTKLMGEYMVERYAASYAIPFLIMRLENVFGHGDSSSRVIPHTISRLREGGAPLLFNKGTAQRGFVYVRDVVRFVEQGLKWMGEGRQGIVNVGTGKQYSVKDVVEEIGRQMGWRGECEHRVGSALPSDNLLSVSKAAGWEWAPTYSLEEGLRETIGGKI